MSEMSPTVAKLFEALAAAQGELEHAKKENVNPAFKSKYADLTSYLDAAKPVLSKHGLCIVQTMRQSADGIIVVTTLGHKSGEWMRGELFIPVVRKDGQGYGSACTYARRYSFAAMVGLGADDDDGNAASLPPPQRGPIKAPTPPEGVEYALGQSVDMMRECVAINEKLAAAKTMGEVQAAWSEVTALQKRGLSRPHIESLKKLKDKRKAELQPANGAA